MLKLKSNDNLSIGTRIYLPEEWHQKILDFCIRKKLPYEFVIESVIEDEIKNISYCVCSAKDNERSYKLAIDDYVVKYIFAQTVPDLNVGLFFDEYLPPEKTKIIITSLMNPREIVLASIHMDLDLINVDGESVVHLKFNLDFIAGIGFSSLKRYLDFSKRYVWKFLDNPDTSYMTDFEKVFQDTLIHKEFFMKSSEKLAKYLDKVGAIVHAQALRQRAIIHDNSKINNEEEMKALSKIIDDKTNLRDPSIQLSPIKIDAVKLHWQNNSHHPEHYNTPIDMTRLDVIEMCCDWYARSMQYETNFTEFVIKRQNERFHFPEWMFSEIWHYCEVLNTDE